MRIFTASILFALLSISILAIGINGHVFVAAAGKPVAGPSFPSGATHYWRFEDLNDSIGSFNLTGFSTSIVSGKHNNCLKCSSGGEADMSISDSLPINNAFTLACWVKLESGISTAIMSSDTKTYIEVDTGTPWTCSSGDEELIMSVASTAVFHLYVLEYDGASTVRGSVDGGTFFTGHAIAQTATYFAWGGFNGADVYFDESVFWTRALTQQEVTDLWNGGNGLFQ